MRFSKSLALSLLRCWKECTCGRALELTVTAMTIAYVVLALGFATGCNRAVLIPESSPTRVGPAMQGQIYTMVDGKWILSDNKIQIPEGWYIVPPSYVEEE
jgi:hypothetical protein